MNYMIKAILFDMDGTLVDTEGIDRSIAIKMRKELGGDLTDEEENQRHGKTTKSFYEYIFQKRGLDFDLEKTIQKHLALFEKELKRGVKYFQGAKELPKILKATGYKLALVSSGAKSQIEINLKHLGVRNFFDVIVSADDISESKPDPQGYLLAAKKLDVKPEECLVLEDAAVGIQAAKSAKMKVIGIQNGSKQDLSLADSVVENLDQVTIVQIRKLP